MVFVPKVLPSKPSSKHVAHKYCVEQGGKDSKFACVMGSQKMEKFQKVPTESQFYSIHYMDQETLGFVLLCLFVVLVFIVCVKGVKMSQTLLRIE